MTHDSFVLSCTAFALAGYLIGVVVCFRAARRLR